MNTVHRFFALFLLLVFWAFVSAQVLPDLYKNENQSQMNHWVDSVFNQMSREQKVGQLFTIIIAGNNNTTNKKRIENLVTDNKIGGILFSKISIRDHAELTNYAQSLAETPLWVALDGEWGLGMRIGGTTPWPRNMMLGAIQNDSLLYAYGAEVARQCKVMGIHINFAPDIDVNSNPNNPVIGNRSFGESPERVGKLGVMYSKGLESGKVLSVAKHFPGHGDTSTDSHHTLPLIQHSIERLNNFELIPFRAYIEAGLGGVMVAHLSIPALDTKKQPSSLSKAVIQDLLIDKLKFEGLVFTDGMQMKGVSSESNHSVRALLAGNDVVLSPIAITREINAVINAVKDGEISEELLNKKVKKILSYKYILGAVSKKQTYVDAKDIQTKLNTPYSDWLNRKLNENAITLLKDEKQLVPLRGLDKRKIAAVSIDPGGETYFLDRLKDYGNVELFSVKDVSELLLLKSKLANFNTIIIGIHSRKLINTASINEIIKGKQSVLAFFVYPYELKNFRSVIENADVVALGYEDTKLANDFVAEAIFGGRSFKGKLPVTIANFFDLGTGILTSKNRLSYGIPEEVNVSSTAITVLDSIVRAGILNNAYPGAQLLVAKDGVIIYNKAFGHVTYNGKDVKKTDLFDLASMSKASGTLPAVMKLHSDGKIVLSDPISKYVPELKNTDKSKITIREALLHETGLLPYIPYYSKTIDKDSYTGNLFNKTKTVLYKNGFDKNTYAQDFKFKPDLVSNVKKAGFTSLADKLFINEAYSDTIVQMIVDSKLRANKKYLYSCLNFMLLKEVVEDVSKQDLNEFTQQNFFSRLGAASTTYNPLNIFDKEDIVPTEQDDFFRSQLVQGYVHDEGAALMGGISGNAGLFSNANDLAKLYQMYLNSGTYGGEEYLSENTAKLFTRTKSASSRRGLGFDKPEPGLTKYGPTSPSTPPTTYGHTGFTGTCFWIDPDNQMIFIFLTNRVYPKRFPNKLSESNTRHLLQEQLYKAIHEGEKLRFR